MPWIVPLVFVVATEYYKYSVPRSTSMPALGRCRCRLRLWVPQAGLVPLSLPYTGPNIAVARFGGPAVRVAVATFVAALAAALGGSRFVETWQRLAELVLRGGELLALAALSVAAAHSQSELVAPGLGAPWTKLGAVVRRGFVEGVVHGAASTPRD